MSEPTTQAGQRLWDILGGADDGLTVRMVVDIEREARAPLVEALRRLLVHECPTDDSPVMPCCAHRSSDRRRARTEEEAMNKPVWVTYINSEMAIADSAEHLSALIRQSLDGDPEREPVIVIARIEVLQHLRNNSFWHYGTSEAIVGLPDGTLRRASDPL